MIEDLKAMTANNVPIKGCFVINKCDLKPFKQKDGYFMSCELVDRTGMIKGIIWDNAEAIKKKVKNGMVIDVVGDLSRYGDVPQIVIKSVSEATSYQMSDFVPSLDDKVIQKLWVDLTELGETLKDTTCKQIWKAVIGKYGDSFKQCPGGVGTVHHNYIGGLLEHSLSMMHVGSDYCSRAREIKINRDVVITGCLLHDLGKIRAYNWGTVIEMSDEGRLMHHIPLSLEFLARVIDDTCDPRIVLQLRHIIVSHHGEEGMTKPMSIEALVVSGADSMDAIINHADNWISEPSNQKEGGNWTSFCQLTSRFYYSPKPSVVVDQPKPEKSKSPLSDLLDSAF